MALGLIAILVAGTSIAQEAGPRLLRDDRGKIAGVSGVGVPCDMSDTLCHPYTSTGVITWIDRERKSDLLTSFALTLPSGNIELQNFDDTHAGLSRGDMRDLGRWLEKGMKVTVSGTTSGGVGGAIVDSISLVPDR